MHPISGDGYAQLHEFKPLCLPLVLVLGSPAETKGLIEFS